jgi:hypothetical protein
MTDIKDRFSGLAETAREFALDCADASYGLDGQVSPNYYLGLAAVEGVITTMAFSGAKNIEGEALPKLLKRSAAVAIGLTAGFMGTYDLFTHIGLSIHQGRLDDSEAQ